MRLGAVSFHFQVLRTTEKFLEKKHVANALQFERRSILRIF